MRRPTTSRRSRAGFTLAELVVALGAALLLTVGVGQIFRSVGSIVSSGSAIAEVDQLARAIERQLRDDFASLNNMAEDETFMAIRNRVITDVYLSREDLEADQRDPAVIGTVFSRVLPETRLDELMFIGRSRERGFLSYELNPPIGPTGPIAGLFTGDTVDSSEARIYYGHGLRPVPIPVDIAPNTTFGRIPDGTFGDEADDPNIFEIGVILYTDTDGTTQGVDTMEVSVDERNRFAGDWPLARQALLLHENGGAIMGQGATGSTSPRTTAIGQQREYAPFIRDHENEFRIGITDANPDPGANTIAYRAPAGVNIEPTLLPNPRAIRHGRVDICAQSHADVQRWLEGREVDQSNVPFIFGPDASAWTDGAWGRTFDPTMPRPANNNPATINDRDAVLWDRVLNDPFNPEPDLIRNFTELQSAIAGCFARPLVETEPPVVPRSVDPSLIDASSTTTEDALMDLHATLAPRCSRFEVAWSDGSVWESEGQLDRMSDASNFFRPDEDAIEMGDLIWFDYNFTRSDLWAVEPAFHLEPDNGLGRPRELQDPEILPNTAPVADPTGRAFYRTDWAGIAETDERNARLNLFPEATGTDLNAYDPIRSGGDFGEEETNSMDDGEYLAIFPFRRLSRDGYTYVGAYAKPRYIRIRMTLHDSQLRLRDGKEYEFILRVNLGSR